jgi:hypothetical protein
VHSKILSRESSQTFVQNISSGGIFKPCPGRPVGSGAEGQRRCAEVGCGVVVGVHQAHLGACLRAPRGRIRQDLPCPPDARAAPGPGAVLPWRLQKAARNRSPLFRPRVGQTQAAPEGIPRFPRAGRMLPPRRRNILLREMTRDSGYSSVRSPTAARSTRCGGSTATAATPSSSPCRASSAASACGMWPRARRAPPRCAPASWPPAHLRAKSVGPRRRCRTACPGRA